MFTQVNIMSSKNFTTRMTCFSLISAIETDLRSVISGMDTSIDFELPIDVIENVKFRYKSHHNEDSSDGSVQEDLLEFSDLSNLSNLSNLTSKNKNKQTIFSIEETSQIVNGLNNLVQARNRVCHSRPLEYNDITELTDFCTFLREAGSRQWWGNINEALNNLDNPSFALSLQIPSYWNKTKTSVVNNLPPPEFDDTVFWGRKEERKAVKA